MLDLDEIWWNAVAGILAGCHQNLLDFINQ
jgi:hypothetical protein